MKPDDKPQPQSDDDHDDSPDGRGSRPTDPNELGKWMVDQTTADKPANHDGKTCRQASL